MAHPYIWEAVKIIQEEETNATLSYINARDGGKPTPRRKKDVQKDGKISTFRYMLEHINNNAESEHQITLETSIKRVNSILFIAVKRPRNARVESDDD